MISVARRELIFVIIVSCIVVFLSLFQTLAFFIKTPDGHVYPLVHGYPPDYYWYLSLMEQGREGKFLLTSRYTPEPFQPKFINTFFPAAGVAAKVFHLSLPVVYLALRVIFGVSQLVAAYFLAAAVFEDRERRTLSFVLAIVGTPFWYLGSDRYLHLVGESWSGLDPLVRNAYLPHHMAAMTLFMLSLVVLSLGVDKRKIILIVESGVLIATATWVNPAIGLLTVWSLTVALVVGLPTAKKRLISIGFALLAAVVPLLFLYRLQNSVFPWTAFRDWERFNFYPFTAMTFLGTLGLTGIFALLGFVIALPKRNFMWAAILGWFLSPLLGFGVLQYIAPISNARYLQWSSYLPAAILATLGITTAYRSWLKRHLAKRLFWPLLTFAFLITSLPSFWQSINQQLQSVSRDSANPTVTVPTKVIEGFDWLNTYGASDQVVLAPGWISTLLPAFTNKRVLWGHPTLTYHEQEKGEEIAAFYGYKDMLAAKEILKKYGVFLVWSDSAHLPNAKFIESLGLIRVFHGDNATIYLVQSQSAL